MTIRARVLEDFLDFQSNQIRVMVARDDVYLRSDGTWDAVEEGATIGEGFGLVIPKPIIEAVVTAIADWQGHTSHADTEAKVLREWLEVERNRVDDLLFAMRERMDGDK